MHLWIMLGCWLVVAPLLACFSGPFIGVKERGMPGEAAHGSSADEPESTDAHVTSDEPASLVAAR